MRVSHPSAWFQKSIKKSQVTERDQSVGLLSPHPSSSSSSSSRQITTPSTFNPPHLNSRDNTARPSSAASFQTAYTATTDAYRSTLTLRTQDFHSHPFATMAHAPLPVVSSHDSSEEEEDCPVCLEPLSFSFRLPGEKPHIVPECGHALHEVSCLSISSPLLVCGVFLFGMVCALGAQVSSSHGMRRKIFILPMGFPLPGGSCVPFRPSFAVLSPSIVLFPALLPCLSYGEMSEILTRSVHFLGYVICQFYLFEH
jgi:hypothetical protein